MDPVTIVVVILALIGWAGTVLPGLPGVILIFGAALLHRFAAASSAVGPSTLWTLGLLAGAATAAGYWASAVGARRYGAGKAGLIGATVGAIAGLFVFGPLGIIVGPLVGAVVGELLAGRPPREALRAGVGAVLGGLGGVVLQFAVGTVMFGLLMWALFF